MILALNLTRVRMNNPVELLKGGNTGEREPRAKWLMAFLGVICLGVGYYLAVTTDLRSAILFSLAVIWSWQERIFFYSRKYCDSETASKEQKVLL